MSETGLQERARDRALVARALAELLGGRPRADTTVPILAEREAFAGLLRGADYEQAAAALRREHARLRRAFKGVPGASPGPARWLRRLALLAEGEAQALADNRAVVARNARSAQVRLLRSPLLEWAIPFGPALERNTGEPLLRIVVGQASIFLLSECDFLVREMGAKGGQRAQPGGNAVTSPPTTAEEAVASPAKGGVVLSVEDLRRLGAALHLPVPRAHFVETVHALFAAARQAGRLASLCAPLHLEWRGRIDRYGQWGMLYPSAAAACWEWRERALHALPLIEPAPSDGLTREGDAGHHHR